MRFDKQVSFVSASEEVYNPDTSSYEAGAEVKNSFLANISDMGLKRTMEIFGDYRKDRKVLRLQNPYLGDFTHILYNGRKYKFTVDKQDKSVFYIEEGI